MSEHEHVWRPMTLEVNGVAAVTDYDIMCDCGAVRLTPPPPDDLDAALAAVPPEPVTSVSTARPRRHRHVYDRFIGDDLVYGNHACACGAIQDPAASRRGRNNRKRGGKHELAIARMYGGRKVGELKLPWDIEGALYATQVKTHVGLPPQRWSLRVARIEDVVAALVSGGGHIYGRAPDEWRAIFGAMDGAWRTPRLIERYLPGKGIRAIDFIVMRWSDDPSDARPMFGGHQPAFVVYRGEDWLDRYGRDE